MRRFNPSIVISSLALLFALGGGAVAAVNFPMNSVGSPQIKDGSIQRKDLSPGIRGTLASTGASTPIPGPAGPTGSAGPQGPSGGTGATGAAGATGATGARGATGATGAQGPQGSPGAPGPQGETGPEGPANGLDRVFAEFDYQILPPNNDRVTSLKETDGPITLLLDSTSHEGVICLSTGSFDTMFMVVDHDPEEPREFGEVDLPFVDVDCPSGTDVTIHTGSDMTVYFFGESN
jgi:collagen triple helix repeat protein